MNIEEIIKELISCVNSTLGYFESGYVSVKRTPFSEKERIESFKQYVEARFNYECCKIPELYNAEVMTNGHLFSCIELINPDEIKRKFSTAIVSLVDQKTLVEPDENLINELNKVREFLGGSTIKFNNVKKKIKFTVEN